jgi:hypothetical protein
MRVGAIGEEGRQTGVLQRASKVLRQVIHIGTATSARDYSDFA